MNKIIYVKCSSTGEYKGLKWIDEKDIIKDEEKTGNGVFNCTYISSERGERFSFYYLERFFIDVDIQIKIHP